MKRKLIAILSLIVVVALSLGIFAACKKGLDTEQLDKLYKAFTNKHRGDATETPISYWVEGDVFYLDDDGKEVKANIKWTIEGTDKVTVGTEANVMGNYEIIVPEEVDNAINYKLVGTLVDDNGKEYTDKDGNPYKLVLDKVVLAGLGKGTQENPYSVSGVLAQYLTLGEKEWSEEKMYVKGIVVTAPSYSSKYQSYTFWMADSKDSTNKLQVYSGKPASGISKIYQNDTVLVNGFFYKYSSTNPELTGSDKDADKHDYPEVISCTTGTSAISVLPNDNAEVILSKNSGVNGTTFTFTVTAKNNAEISSVKVNGAEVTAANGTYTGTIEGDTTVSVVALVATSGEQTITVDLAEGFGTYASEWSTSYSQKTLDSAILGINTVNMTLVLSNANKSTSTITDVPVMAAKSNTMQYATLTVNGCQINEVTFNLREWSSAKKFNTICIEYTTDGTNWTMVQGVGIKDASPEQGATNYSTLKAEYLPSSVTGVRLAFTGSDSSNQQLGLEGFTVKTGPVTVDNSEARIGSTKYDTLAEAIAEAQDNDTITLTKDVVIAAELKITKKITLNLNGKTISNTEDIYGNDGCSLIAVMANGELTITGNGKLDAKENDCYALSVFNGGKLTVENGEFVGNKHSVYAYEGNVVINGGTYSIKQLSSGEGMDRYRFLLNLYDANGAAGTATITVYGGSFVNYDPAHSKSESPEVSFLAEGYETTSKQEGGNTIYTVRLAPPTTDHAGTAADPYSVADAKKWADYLNGATSAQPVYVTGTIKGTITQSNREGSENRYNFNIVTNADDEQVCIMYYVLTAAAPQEGDVVVVKGYLMLFNGSPEIKQDGGLVVSVNGTDTGLDGGNTPTPPAEDDTTILGQIKNAAVSAPAASGSYVLVIWQGTLQKPIYATGAMNGKFLATTEDISAAATVTAEEATGGFYLALTVDGVKKYVTVTPRESDTSKADISLADTATSIFTVNANGLLVSGDFVLGTYGSFNTISVSNISYFSSTSVIDSTQYIVRIIPADTTLNIPDGTIKEATTNENATVAFTELTPVEGVVTAKWYTTVKFTVTPASGYVVDTVKVGGKALTAKENVYEVELIGDVEIVITVKEENAEPETSITFDFSELTGKGSNISSVEGAQTALDNVVGAGKCTVVTATNVYSGNGTGGRFANTEGLLKMGASKKTGTLELTFASNVKKVEIKCCNWSDGSGDTVTVNAGTAQAAANSDTAAVLTFDGLDTTTITISTNYRVFIYEIVVYFE